MPASTENYRKLPGRLRGVIHGASVWAGSDHLLLVCSTRFREEYKRFFYRDIQAIAVAEDRRFPVPTPTILLAAIAIAAGIVTGRFAPRLAPFWWIPLAALAGAWLYVSIAQSCRCRIYTAVSGDELPSIYRRWTARRFLAAAEPLIAATQGSLEGNWAEAAEERPAGPMERFAEEPAEALKPRAQRRVRSPASDLLIVSLFAAALGDTIAQLGTGAVRWLPSVFGLFEITAAVAVLVEYSRGRLAPAMRYLAIATMILIAVLFYGETLTVGIMAGVTSARSQGSNITVVTPLLSGYPAVRRMRAGVSAVLGLAGIVLSWKKSSLAE
jgi:hypothetical protein